MASLFDLPVLDAKGVTIRYREGGRTVTATDSIDLSIFHGDRVVLLGPSGCGKSTLLKAVAGYLKPAEGTIALRGRPVTGPGPDRMVVFQEFDQLLPWKTVKENVIFPLTTARRISRREAEAAALHWLAKVKLERFVDAYPHTLSGGMKQRVAIARCLAMRPEVVLMDEPFAALDPQTRRRMQEELLELWDGSRFTMLFVTHSVSEAVTVGSRIAVLSPHPGRVREEIPVGEALLRNAHELKGVQEQVKRVLFRDSPEYVI